MYFVQMLYERSAETLLTDWAESRSRKPLLIRGARQVGKSTLVRKFGASFDSFIEINLEKEAYWVDEISRTKSVGDFLALVQIRLDLPDLNGRILLFFDEIQNSPEAIFLLRYFYEEYPSIHVIAAGSLLEFALGDVKSFPVGRVQFFYLGPLSFAEFLSWKGAGQVLAVYRSEQVPDYALDTLFGLYNEYVMVGGMPAAVKEFIQGGSLGGLSGIYTSIWQSYLQDIEKYARNSAERRVISFALRTAPSAEGRITFSKFGNSNYKSKEIAEALRTLEKTRVLRLVYPTTNTEIPLLPDYKKSPKLQLLDTGLMIHALGMLSELLSLSDLQKVFGGRLIEHHLFQEHANAYPLREYSPHFWVRQKAGANSEVDLVFQYGTYAIPVEFKAGPQGRLRSLHQFVDRSGHPYAVRFLRNAYSVERHTTTTGKPYWLMNLPYFLMGRLPHYVERLVNEYTEDVGQK